jgi:hypothetical protein
MSWHESVYFPYHAANLLVVLLAFSTVQFIKLLTELNHLSCESNVLLDKLPQRALQRLAFELNPFEAVKERGDAILHLLEFILHHHMDLNIAGRSIPVIILDGYRAVVRSGICYYREDGYWKDDWWLSVKDS